ncbi:MAG: hypothetical protein K0R59_1892 [Sphingobacterium sp.]|nr:hypothetical protein [Sphingobacterium sp.]
MIYWIDKQMLKIIYFNIFSFDQLNNNKYIAGRCLKSTDII